MSAATRAPLTWAGPFDYNLALASADQASGDALIIHRFVAPPLQGAP